MLLMDMRTIIDKCAMADITQKDRGIPPRRCSKIKSMEISNRQVAIVKAGIPEPSQ